MRSKVQNRLAALESQSPRSPTRIFSSRPLEEGEGEKLLVNWKEEVEAGRAGISGNCLFIRVPIMTAEEWLQSVRNRIDRR